uniref:Ig-like domain-containing protein n=1 Tax=Taeniopygia guttata TaxID=59729 RepID=A0A674GAP9_TAEGU
MPVQLGESSPAPLVPLSSAPPAQLPPLQPGHTQGTSLLHSDLGVALEQQPREVTVQEGGEVTFECSMKGEARSFFYMYWYHQGPGGSLKFIYREGDIYGEDFQKNFVGSVEGSSTTLQILAAKQGDAGTYYCGARTTLELLCSRVNQKPTYVEDRSPSISF